MGYYNELARRLRRRYLNSLGNVVLQKPADVYSDCNYASTAITDLLARAEAAEVREKNLQEAIQMVTYRAEAAERERDKLREVLDMYGLEEGITAMLKAAETRCATLEKMVKEYQEELIPGYRERAEKADARVHELETVHRVEICEDGYDCVELGKVRRKLEAAEARAEKAEKLIDWIYSEAKLSVEHNIRKYLDWLKIKIEEWRGQKEE